MANQVSLLLPTCAFNENKYQQQIENYTRFDILPGVRQSEASIVIQPARVWYDSEPELRVYWVKLKTSSFLIKIKKILKDIVLDKEFKQYYLLRWMDVEWKDVDKMVRSIFQIIFNFKIY